MNTQERLEGYHTFSRQVIGDVAEVAEQQNTKTFEQLAEQYGIANGPELCMPIDAHSPIEVLYFKPKRENYDRHFARVYMPSYGCPLDKIRTMHHLRLFGAANDTQYIVFGTPTVIGDSYAALTPPEMSSVARGSMAPIARPILSLLAEAGVERLEVLGYSAGADKVPGIARYANRYDIDVRGAVMAEPVGAVPRSLTNLAMSFMRSGSEQAAYRDGTESTPYLKLWEDDSLLGFARWAGGLLRPSNVVFAAHLAKGRYTQDLEDALIISENMHSSVIWGSESEMANPNALRIRTRDLAARYDGRVTGIEVPGMHHAAVDDIDLHAALFLHGLKKAKDTIRDPRN